MANDDNLDFDWSFKYGHAPTYQRPVNRPLFAVFSLLPFLALAAAGGVLISWGITEMGRVMG